MPPRPSTSTRRPAPSSVSASSAPASTSTRAPRPAAPPAPSSIRPSSAPRGSATMTAGQEGAGALLALFAYPLLVNLLAGGPARMWGWVKAKWINQPYKG